MVANGPAGGDRRDVWLGLFCTVISRPATRKGWRSGIDRLDGLSARIKMLGTRTGRRRRRSRSCGKPCCANTPAAPKRPSIAHVGLSLHHIRVGWMTSPTHHRGSEIDSSGGRHEVDKERCGITVAGTAPMLATHGRARRGIGPVPPLLNALAQLPLGVTSFGFAVVRRHQDGMARTSALHRPAIQPGHDRVGVALVTTGQQGIGERMVSALLTALILGLIAGLLVPYVRCLFVAAVNPAGQRPPRR